jgi:hypothetical protein
MVESLPSKLEAPSSNLSTAKKEKNYIYIYIYIYIYKIVDEGNVGFEPVLSLASYVTLKQLLPLRASLKR